MTTPTSHRPRERVRALVTLTLELWAVEILILDDGTEAPRRAALALSSEPEHEDIVLGALHLPNRWASLDEVNLALLAFTREQAALVASGREPLLSVEVLGALGIVDGGGDACPESLGIPCRRTSLAEAREELRVVLDVTPPDAAGHLSLTRRLAFASAGAPRDRDHAMRRHLARILWLELGGESLTEVETVPDPTAFVARLGREGIAIERRFLSAAQVRQRLGGG